MADDCAILAIASTTETVHALLQKLIAGKDPNPDPDSNDVPWTLANKYYTAEVAFVVRPFSAWAAAEEGVLRAPALVFVWKRGEPYREQVRRLAQGASFEVALAVRLPGSGGVEGDEEEEDVDAYLSSEGFEFVDVADADEASSLPDRSGIPGIPRIVDALSTIMWPSMRMIRQPSKGKGGTSADAVQNTTDDYHTLVRLVGERIGGGEDRMKRELEALERWLDGDADKEGGEDGDGDGEGDGEEGEGEEIPWSTVVSPGTLSPSSSGFLETSRPSTPTLTLKTGFDDDFTCFVSAPGESAPVAASVSALASASGPASGPSLSRPRPWPERASTTFGFGATFQFEGTSDSGRSSPALDRARAVMLGPGGEAYTSLGSVSDLGLGADADGDGGVDVDMPTRAEIADASRRIFGDSLTRSPVQAQFRGDEAAATGPGPDGDLERFDLQGVLGALQGLKEEIAGMPDEARRKAAARVALGLAYGLGGGEEVV